MSTSYYFPTLFTNPVYPLDESMKDGALRSSPENGIVLARDRFTRDSRREWKVKYEYITTYEKQLIDAFVQTVRGGARSFYWANPATSQDIFSPYGSFGSTSGWSTTDCTIAIAPNGISGNCLQLTRTGGVTAQSINKTYNVLETGEIYIITAWVKSGTSGDESCKIGYYDITNNIENYYSGTSSSTWSVLQTSFVATSTYYQFLLYKWSATAGTMLFDEFTLLKVTNEVRFSELPKYSYIINDYWNCEFALKEV